MQRQKEKEYADVSFTPEMADALEGRLGYHFRDRLLLRQALTHRSYVHEHEEQGLRHNEALEFLGDAVLGFLISSRIFRRYPESNEGDLSKMKAYLVSATNLMKLAKAIRLGECVLLSRCEEKTGGRHKRNIVADAWEAILGAIFLDGGVLAASEFLNHQMKDCIEEIDLDKLTARDFKSALQERLHDLGRSEPVYRVVNELGPDHEKTFVIQAVVDGEVVAEASGGTKKAAQKAAAQLALERLK
ncbi:MAG: ribonuclease III [Acidobacteriota bacterium]|jgi:ribonuclease-3|nr:ribonuclease III [Acidobacteriota bacterium]